MEHFEYLWVLAENKLKDETEASTIEQICKEMSVKLALYGSLTNYTEDISFAKNRLLGDIVLLLTQITMKDNVDIYAVLQEALKKH